MKRSEAKVERRFTNGEVELRTVGSKSVISGHAAVFDKRSQNLGGFVEVVGRTAFNKTLADRADVRALQNHDENLVLGRTRSGTLKLSVDDSGLYYEVDPPDTSYARDLMVVMERGDVTQSSFAFFAVDDDWETSEDDTPLRSLKEVGLVDVSPVTYPAYLDATSGVLRNNALAGLAKRSGVDLRELANDDEAVRQAIGILRKTTDDESRESTPDPKWTQRLAFIADLDRALKP